MKTLRSTYPVPNSHDAAVAVSGTDLVRIYGAGETAVRALNGVSVAIAGGRLTSVMGPSGSGKSTLLQVLAGLERPTTGQVRIGSTPLDGLDDRALARLRRTQMGFVFQHFNLVPSLTAAANITLPLRLDGRRPDPAWFDTVIDTVGLGDRLHHRPAELSGGQQQRVAVARALLARPAVVFADEPTGNLDTVSSAEVLAFLRRSVEEHGQTIVMVTHDPHAASHADRVVFLKDGLLVDEVGEVTTSAVIERMRTLGA